MRRDEQKLLELARLNGTIWLCGRGLKGLPLCTLEMVCVTGQSARLLFVLLKWPNFRQGSLFRPVPATESLQLARFGAYHAVATPNNIGETIAD